MRKSKKKSKYQHLYGHPDVGPWLSGYGRSVQLSYAREFDRFLKWLKKTPKQLVKERKADLKRENEYERRRYERLVVQFFKSIKSPGTAQKAVVAARSFFNFRFGKRGELDFTAHELKEFGKVKTVYTDYLPTCEDLKTMVEVSDVRDRAIILTVASTGIGGDICEFTREQFKHGLARRASPHDPVHMAPRGKYLRRLKTNVRMRPFLTCDAANAIKLYLQTRKDHSPWLFVDRSGKKLTTDALNKVVTRTVKKARIDIPKGQRMRLHNFRDFFSEAAHDADIPHDWICVLYGRAISGSEDFYAHATEEKLREKFKRVESRLSVSRISNMTLMRDQQQRALDDNTKMILTLISHIVDDEERLRDAVAYILSQPKVKWDPKKEIEPTVNRVQRILGEVLGRERIKRLRGRQRYTRTIRKAGRNPKKGAGFR